ncbi:673_t:CDS:2, partial [Acaulospora morrowiae]
SFSASSTSSTEKRDIEQHVIYKAPFAIACRRLKKFSIASLITTVSFTPLIFILDNSLNLKAQTLMALFVISTSAASTMLIHRCISPYVAKITYNPPEAFNSSTKENSKDSDDLKQKISENKTSSKITPETFLTFETLTLLGTSNFTTLQVKSLEPSSRFFTTWKVKDDHKGNVSAVTSSGKKAVAKNWFYVQTELFDNPEMQDVSRIVM